MAELAIALASNGRKMSVRRHGADATAARLFLQIETG
jgi:hypothetical protein